MTGGAGYIGSHTVVELLKDNYSVVVVDSLVNAVEGTDGTPVSLRRVEQITGVNVSFYKADIRNRASLEKVFTNHKISAVLHFAGLKSVNESVRLPLEYYNNHISGTITLLETMKKFGVKQLIFSSSATVYGPPQELPVSDSHEVGRGITNPYGRTKFIIEEMLRDLSVSDASWKITMLRYFNPVGAHESGLIGEDPVGPPNNLLPYISQVAIGRREHLTIFGDDWDTPDGTAIRDWIHVVDLAMGHIAALKKLESNNGVKVYNLGAGNGYSVLEAIKAFEKASGRPVQYKIGPRRPGDLANVVADSSASARELGWSCTRGLEDMCRDLWRWQSQNPTGYQL